MHAETKRLFVGNLPPDTTQTDIRKRFSKFGNVLSVEIKHRSDSSAFAFLDFKTDEDKLNSCKMVCIFCKYVRRSDGRSS
jgi:RNA recognition motif-containing protein